MKKCVAALLVLILSVNIVIPFSSLNAKKANTSSEPETVSAFVSIYDDILDVYIIPNSSFSFEKGSQIVDILEVFVQEEKIISYSYGNGTLNSLITLENIEYLYQAGTASFYLKRNGSILSIEQWNDTIQNGDIIEWIYNTEQEVTVNTPIENDVSSQTIEKVPSILWNEEYSKSFNNACDWLDRNAENSTSYLMVFGIAGKTANIKMVNQMVSQLTKATEYETATVLSKQILSATFCGFDVRAEKYGGLLKKLTTYPAPMKQGIFGAINPLTAYDCNKYPVSNTVPNSRDVLIQNILKYQNEDGGFSISEKSASDIDTTAMAITALSTYQDRTNVKQAIEKGFDFLASQQTESGGFGYRGQENCESLATVIIACASMNIPLNDQRFMKNEKNLLDQLIEYKNSDGSFSHLKETPGSIMPTEQAIIAMAAVKKGGNPYILSQIIQPLEEDTATQHVPLQLKASSWIIWCIIAGIILFGVSAIVITHKVMRNREKKGQQ